MGMTKPRKWTEKEDEFLRKNYNDMYSFELGKALGRSHWSVRHRLSILKLNRHDDSKVLRDRGKRFKKGSVPWNKGVKGTHFSPDSEFKKGILPHNTKYDGCISVRYDYGVPYKYICLSLGKWQGMHRFVWETYHGKKIPPKHVVRFIDGDTMNCHISNLEMITMNKNVRRNYTPPKITDEYAAWNLSKRQDFTKEDALKYPELIELQKIRLHHNREIKYARQKDTADSRSDKK